MASKTKPKPRQRAGREMPTDPEAAITRDQTAIVLGIAAITLDQQRQRGQGPRFFKIGRTVRYRLGDVLAYRDARMVGAK